MTTSTSTAHSEITGLPHWEKLPDDVPAAITEIKAALRARIAASGRTVEQVVEDERPADHVVLPLADRARQRVGRAAGRHDEERRRVLEAAGDAVARRPPLWIIRDVQPELTLRAALRVQLDLLARELAEHDVASAEHLERLRVPGVEAVNVQSATE